MKFNTTEKTIDGTRFIFVTRGRSKAFTDEEVSFFLNDMLSNGEWPSDSETIVEDKFVLRGELVPMFLKDMRQFGADFCAKKHGATVKQIIAEAQRIAPYLKVD